MRIEQELFWYKDKYLESEWKVKDSKHYAFHYFADSETEKDIEEIANIKEKHYEKITSFLKVQNDWIIDYYLYPSVEVKTQLMGDDSPGNAIWKGFELVSGKPITEKFEIHVVYGDEFKFIGEHEDTHLLSLPFGLSIYLFCEGLAQFMEGNLFGTDIDMLSRKLLEDEKLYPISELIDNKYWDNVEPPIIYTEVGSFSRFIINNYSWDKYREIYQQTSRLKSPEENLRVFESVLQDSVTEVEDDWKKYLVDSLGS